MTEYYIMMIDGKTVHVSSIDKAGAFTSAMNLLDYDSFDEFLEDVNLCEWKDSENRIVEWYKESTEVVRFDRNSEYQLKEYTKASIQDELYSTAS